MVESSTTKQVAKRSWKEETKAKKKEKILGKIVMVKEVKGFNPIVCHIKDTTIGEEYVNSFPLGFSPVQDVFLFVNRFKMSPPDIIYRPFSKEHVNEIKT
jgi:hypothetical protein